MFLKPIFILFKPRYHSYHTPVAVAMDKLKPGNTKGGSITVPLTSCLTGLKSAV
jgi:hypothetical protein